MAEWKVGQEIWIVPSERRGPARSGVIGKVARKWVTMDPPHLGRFDKETGLFDGGGYSSPAKAWVSREAYEARRDFLDKWRELQRKISNKYRPPDHLTMDDLCEIEIQIFSEDFT